MFDIQETTKNADCSFTTKLEDKNVVDIGSDVTLSCCLDKEYRVRWYKDQCEISMNNKFKFKDERWEHKLIIPDIQEEDSGVYSCGSGTTKTSCKLNIEDCSCSFITKLEDRNVADIGSDVTLSCCMDKEYGVRWYKDQREIFQNDKFKFKEERCIHNLIITDIQKKDSGVYSCGSGTTKTSCKLNIEDCFFTTKLEDRNAIGIGSDVTLSCCLDKEYGVQWFKDGCEIFVNDRFKFKDERGEHKLIITDIQEEDAGVYSCQCGTTETSCKLKVKANRFIKQLEDVTITNGEELILACELKAECKEVQWCKTNGTISDCATTTDYRIGGSNAHMYQLDIKSVKMEDAGEYNCHNENVITTCNVTVKEIKIDASLNTTTLLHELSSIKRRIKVKKDEILNTTTNLDRTETDVNQKEIIIEKRETEIAELRTQLKEQENMLKCRDIELERKEQYIQVLKDTNQQLAESVEKLELTLKELESTKQQSKQMQQQIKILEGEKQDMEDRVKTLESYIDDVKNNKQQQKANEEQRKANEEQRKANEQQRKAQEQLQKASEQQQKVLEDMRTMMEEKKSKLCSVS